MDELIDQALQAPTSRIITPIGANTSLMQINKEFGKNIGITVIGEYDDADIFHVEHTFPYFHGNSSTREDSIQIEQYSSKEAYAGVCEDMNLSMTLIFYLQNIADYVGTMWSNTFSKKLTTVSLSALSNKGKILFQIEKNEKQIRKERALKKNRNQLLAQARAGDTDAMESLTLEDMNMYNTLTKRIKHEDIYTIVDSYFMPYGIENDHYSILGTILHVDETVNEITKEELYLLDLECNDTNLSVCINKMDLIGEPAVGRRFKGTIWLQGKIWFSY